MGIKNVHYKGIYLIGLHDTGLFNNGNVQAAEAETLVAAESKGRWKYWTQRKSVHLLLQMSLNQSRVSGPLNQYALL